MTVECVKIILLRCCIFVCLGCSPLAQGAHEQARLGFKVSSDERLHSYSRQFTFLLKHARYDEAIELVKSESIPDAWVYTFDLLAQEENGALPFVSVSDTQEACCKRGRLLAPPRFVSESDLLSKHKCRIADVRAAISRRLGKFKDLF